MLETVIEVDEDEEEAARESVSTRGSETGLFEKSIVALADAVQAYHKGQPLHIDELQHRLPVSSFSSRSSSQNLKCQSTGPSRRESISIQPPPPEQRASSSRKVSTHLRPILEQCQTQKATQMHVASPTKFHTWEDNLLRCLRQMRLDEEQRLLDRRESLRIEIPASPRSPVGRRLSGLQTPTFPMTFKSDTEGQDAILGDNEGPYANFGPYQLVYANSTLQDLHHQIDDSRGFMYSILEFGSQSQGLGGKSQANRSSLAIMRMLDRLEKACGRISREQELVVEEMDLRAPKKKWKNMLDTVVAMSSVLAVDSRAEEKS